MLRRLALLNFTLWLGTGFGIAFVAIPVVFSPAIKTQLPPGQAGTVAQAILLRFFMWQVGWAGISGLLLGLERLKNPATLPRLRSWILPPMILLSLVLLFWVHPTLSHMHQERYALETPEPRKRELAASFGRWHGVSQGLNLIILIGALACWRDVAQSVLSFGNSDGRGSR